VPRGLSSPELNFLKSAHGHSCPEVHHRVESIEFNWLILGQMAIFARKLQKKLFSQNFSKDIHLEKSRRSRWRFDEMFVAASCIGV
jgi:hypothetical protein